MIISHKKQGGQAFFTRIYNVSVIEVSGCLPVKLPEMLRKFEKTKQDKNGQVSKIRYKIWKMGIVVFLPRIQPSQDVRTIFSRTQAVTLVKTILCRHICLGLTTTCLII